jgi:hypothetical protein
MGVKISELPAASALAGTESIPLVQATETRKATVADIAPVRSVAGKVGAVTLSASDCSAAAAVHTHDYAATLHQPPGIAVGTGRVILSGTARLTAPPARVYARGDVIDELALVLALAA